MPLFIRLFWFLFSRKEGDTAEVSGPAWLSRKVNRRTVIAGTAGVVLTQTTEQRSKAQKRKAKRRARKKQQKKQNRGRQPKGQNPQKPNPGRKKKGGGNSRRTRKPNVLLINLDDISAREMQFGLPRTFAYFKKRGMISWNYICENPVCGPARAALLTGKSCDINGVRTNRQAKKGIRGQTLAMLLHRIGYTTFLLGKDLNGLKGKLRGFDEYDTESGGKQKKVRGKFVTEYYGKELKTFIQKNKKNPWFVYFAPHIPHFPYKFDKRFKNRFNKLTARMGRPAFNEADVSDKPTPIRKLPLLDEGKMNRIARARMRSLISMDALIMKTIRSLGSEEKNTLIIIVGDNGFGLGANRVETKGAPYDESIKTLLFAKGPGIGRGVQSYDLNAVQDVAVTISRIVGFRIKGANGEDFRPGKGRRRPYVKIQFYQAHTWRGIRGPDWVYVVWETGEEEYYDLKTDPYQMNNLLANWEGHTPQLPPEEADNVRSMFRTAFSHR